VHVRHRIATHGFALNLATDLDGFSTIVPCGLQTAGVTSLHRQIGNVPTLEVGARALIRLFEKNFGVQIVEVRVLGCNRTAPLTRIMEAS
jgi:lipoate-protein ligase B